MIYKKDLIPFSEEEKDLLRQAFHLLETGWCQEVWHSGANYCMVGAITKVSGASCHSDNEQLYHKIAQRLGIQHGTTGHLINWNDDALRTKNEVLTFLRGILK